MVCASLHFDILKIIISGLLSEFAFAYCPQGSLPGGVIEDVTIGSESSTALHCYPGRSFTRSFDPDDDEACISSGNWNEAFPDCKDNTCPQLIDINHGFVTDKRKNKFGDAVKYGCQRGFVIKGPKVRICQCSGEWSGNEPKCIVPPTCPDISVPLNGSIISPNSDAFYEGLKIQFACDAGFSLTGMPITTCQRGRDGLFWSQSPPTCETSVCAKPPSLLNGDWEVFELYNFYQVGAELSYECDFMYENTTQKTIECLSTGKWNTVEDAACIRLVCPTPDIPRNSHLLTSSFKALNYAEFECDENYAGVGDPEENKIYCHLNKTWSKTEYTCEINICSLDSGLLSPQLQINPEKTEYNQSDVINVGCKDGKWPVLLGKPLPDVKGRVKIRCKFGGKWSRNFNDVQCAEVCGKPSVLLNGSWQFHESKTEFIAGTVISYKCDKFHENTTRTNVECDSSGLWEPNDPGCLWITCPYPKLPANSHLLGSAFRALENHTIGCDENYAGIGDVGSNKIYCFLNKTWSETAYKCIRNVCDFDKSMLSPFSQIVNEKTLFQEKEVAVVECVDGKKMFINGSALDSGENSFQFRCRFGGVWTDNFNITECASACIRPSEPANGNWLEKLNEYYKAGDTISYECDDLHENNTLMTVLCLVTESWSVLYPGCVWITCSAPKIPDNSHLVGSEFKALEHTKFECDEKFAGVGRFRSEIFCYPNKTWSVTDYKCILNVCTITSDMLPSSSMIVPEKQEYMEKEALNIQCTDDKKMFVNESSLPVGKASFLMRCEFGGNWSDDFKIIECASSCVKPTSPANGNWSGLLQSYYKIGDFLSYECDPVHENITEKTSECLSSEIWSVNSPACVWITCPEPEIPENSHLLGSEFKALEFTTFECDKKFTGSLDTGPNQLYCYPNKTWSSTDYICLSEVCVFEPSKLPPHSKLSPVEAEYAENESVALECLDDRFPFIDGEFLKNNENRINFTCNYGGAWSDEFGILECVSGCSKPISLENADWAEEPKDVYRAGNAVQYECHTYTYNTSERIIQCLGNRTWSSDNPRCEWLTCPEPDIPSNSHLLETDYRVSQTVTFECDEKYVGDGVSGTNEIVCNFNTTWTKTDYSCIKNFCEFESISPPASSQISLDKPEYAVNESIVITCTNSTWPYINGTALARYSDGADFVCTLGGTWNLAFDVLECGITCEPPESAEPTIYEVVPYANLPYYFPGSDYTFKCTASGYARSGHRNFTCQENGTWSAISGCHYVTCAFDPDVIHSTVESTLFQIMKREHRPGSTIPIFCKIRDNSYRLRNGTDGAILTSNFAVCLEDGNWNINFSGIFCTRFCTKPTVENGLILDDTEGAFAGDGDTIEIQCDEGYMMIGNHQTTCSDGKWSEYGSCITITILGL